MELAFCYIENYKNLEDIKFNFELKFEFDLEKKDNEYIINRKKVENMNQTPDFFDKNISNITGIIGENGTGKTSLLEALFKQFIRKNKKQVYKLNNNRNNNIDFDTIEYYNFIMLFKVSEDDYYYFSALNSNRVFFKKGNNSNKIAIESIDNLKQNNSLSYLYVDSILSKKPAKIEKSNLISKFDFSSSTLIEGYGGNIYAYASNELKREINFIIKYRDRKQLVKNTGVSFPQELHLSLPYNQNIKNLDEFYKEILVLFQEKISAFFQEQKHFVFTGNFLNVLEKLVDLNIEYLFKELGIKKEEFISILVKSEKDVKMGSQSIINEINHRLEIMREDLNLKKLSNKEIKKHENFKLNFDPLKKYLLEIDNNEKLEILFKQWVNRSGRKELSNILNFYIYVYMLLSNSNYSTNFRVESGEIVVKLNGKPNNDIKLFLNYFQNSQLEDSYIRYSYDIELSSGEKSILSLFSKLYSAFYEVNNKEKNWILFLDEPEAMMHPEWQRQVLKLLIDFIKKRKLKDFNVQLFITSHSPFLASDLPKENLIMLSKEADFSHGEDDFLRSIVKIVEPNSKKNTFAANIFNLYKNSFYVKSTFGEFGKYRIERLIELLTPDKEGNYRKEIEMKEKEIEYLIASIGERLISVKLNKMYKEYKKKSLKNKEALSIIRKFDNLSLEKKLFLLKKADFHNTTEGEVK